MSKLVYTIGFTKKSAEDFFEMLKNSEIKVMIDVRLNNISQLAGFSKMYDLKYFLKEINNIEYVHLPELAPTKEMLDKYKKQNGTWDEYEFKFKKLLNERKVENISKEVIYNGCLLCSENKPHFCHRRLVVEYLNEKWGGELEIVHL